MQKLLIILTALVTVFTASVCNAMNAMNNERIESELNLGGILLEMSYQDVVNKYGEPNRREKGSAQLVSFSIYYGESVKIDFGFNNQVLAVETVANNGWHTPFGIRVGTAMSNVLNIYGQPDYIGKPNQNQQWTAYIYSYTIPQIDMTRGSINRGLIIYCDSENGNVKGIKIWKEEHDPTPIGTLGRS